MTTSKSKTNQLKTLSVRTSGTIGIRQRETAEEKSFITRGNPPTIEGNSRTEEGHGPIESEVNVGVQGNEDSAANDL